MNDLELKLRQSGAIKEGQTFDEWRADIGREADQIKRDGSASPEGFRMAAELEAWANEKPDDTPIELPVTALGEVAQLLREAQAQVSMMPMRICNLCDLLIPIEGDPISVGHGWHNMPRGGIAQCLAQPLLEANDKLAQARILVDVIIGDGT